MDDLYATGMRVRREVLGDAHVDRAEASKTTLNEEFQALITTSVWGAIWGRPGLGRRERYLILLTILIARGHWEELDLHLVAARRVGLSEDEIKELMLQCAVYCGAPSANRAFAVAKKSFEQYDASG